MSGYDPNDPNDYHKHDPSSDPERADLGRIFFRFQALPDGCLGISAHDVDTSSWAGGTVMLWKGTPEASRKLLIHLLFALDAGKNAILTANAVTPADIEANRAGGG